VFTLIGSAIALNEQILLQHVAGLCFVVIGVILGTGYIDEQFRKKRSHRLSS
jgi:drug/metabolite transporter (DMT)-like permease